MKRLATFLAAASALCGVQVANAQIITPPGTTATFSGPVTVQKDLGVYNCTLTVNVTTGPNVLPPPDVHGGVTITYPHAHTATATASLSGGFPCGLIQVNNTATVTVSGPPTRVVLTGFEIVPPLSFGTCTGPIVGDWSNGPPPTVTLSVPLSNSAATAGAPCKMAGTLTQTGAPWINILYP